jgi:kynureninase
MTDDPAVLDDLRRRAAELDARDELAPFRSRFAPAPGVVAYLDGNSLGRPLRDTAERLAAFARDEWGTRLIRSWGESWMNRPYELGDRIGEVALGAAPGQTVVGDSTTVLLYKLLRAAVEARPDRDEIVAVAGDFPTDRFLVDGIARETGRTVRWIHPDPVQGVSVADVRAAASERTAVVLLSHVDYRSGALLDMPAITRLVTDAGALTLWDLCHSLGVVPMQLDAWGVELAVGCSYKYLNAGPGAPAIAYVRAGLQPQLRQPVQGWMGAADVFAMADEYVPAPGIRRFVSGTPPILAMLPMAGMVELLAEAGVTRVRAKSRSLTDFTVAAYDALLADAGVRLLSPRDADRRGSHVTIGHPAFASMIDGLWERGVIPDFRHPDGLRLGLSPLSTSHEETLAGVAAIAELLRAAP